MTHKFANRSWLMSTRRARDSLTKNAEADSDRGNFIAARTEPQSHYKTMDITGGLVFFLHLIRMHCYQIHSLIPAFTAAPIPGMLTRRSMRSKISLDMIVSTM